MKVIDSNRIYELEEILAKTKECREINAHMDTLFSEIKGYLPEDKRHVVNKIDDCFIDMLILNEEWFYQSGYLDNKKSPASADCLKG